MSIETPEVRSSNAVAKAFQIIIDKIKQVENQNEELQIIINNLQDQINKKESRVVSVSI